MWILLSIGRSELKIYFGLYFAIYFLADFCLASTDRALNKNRKLSFENRYMIDDREVKIGKVFQ